MAVKLIPEDKKIIDHAAEVLSASLAGYISLSNKDCQDIAKYRAFSSAVGKLEKRGIKFFVHLLQLDGSNNPNEIASDFTGEEREAVKSFMEKVLGENVYFGSGISSADKLNVDERYVFDKKTLPLSYRGINTASALREILRQNLVTKQLVYRHYEEAQRKLQEIECCLEVEGNRFLVDRLSEFNKKSSRPFYLETMNELVNNETIQGLVSVWEAVEGEELKQSIEDKLDKVIFGIIKERTEVVKLNYDRVRQQPVNIANLMSQRLG